MKVQLKDIAFARAGDKGDVSNIGVMGKDEAAYKVIKKNVTPKTVKQIFNGVVKGEVEIYDLPNLNAINVVCRNALGGGATRTLRFDQTGKSMGNALLRLEVEINEE